MVLECPKRRLRRVAAIDTKMASFGFDRRLRVLVAEDDFLNRKIIDRLLGKLGIEVVMVEDGLKAVDRCKTDRFDLVFMDVSMPRVDGVEATRRIRKLENCLDLPIIAVTAHNSISTERLCLDAGMNGFLTKPISKEKIIEAVEQCSNLRKVNADFSQSMK